MKSLPVIGQQVRWQGILWRTEYRWSNHHLHGPRETILQLRCLEPTSVPVLTKCNGKPDFFKVCPQEVVTRVEKEFREYDFQVIS